MFGPIPDKGSGISGAAIEGDGLAGKASGAGIREAWDGFDEPEGESVFGFGVTVSGAGNGGGAWRGSGNSELAVE